MKTYKILHFGEIELRKKTKDVTEFDKRLFGIIDALKTTLRSTKGSAALAANQVGILKSIVVIDYENEAFELINPRIVSTYGEQYVYEGCLSFPGYSGKVKRAYTVKIEYQDRNGVKKEVERSGPMALCFQHEIDHLNGILFIDRVEDRFLTNDEDDSKLNIDNLLLLTKVGKEET